MRKTTSRYFRSSKSIKLSYTKEASYDLVVKIDEDWSGDVNDRNSTTGYYFKLNGRDAVLSLGFKKQATCAFFIRSRISGHGSSHPRCTVLEATFVDFSIQQKHQTAIGEDNQNCIRLLKPSHAQEELAYRGKISFLQDMTKNETISIHYVATDKIAADIFTESIPVLKVETFRTLLM